MMVEKVPRRLHLGGRAAEAFVGVNLPSAAVRESIREEKIREEKTEVVLAFFFFFCGLCSLSVGCIQYPMLAPFYNDG